MTEKEEWEIGYSKSIPTEIPEGNLKTDFQQPDVLVGQMLDGRFLIEKNLTDGGADEGGIGLVYLARDMKLLGKETVVKILQKSFLKNEDIARKFLHEKEALIRLDHPNIVRILDSGTLSDGNPFMVMEYIAGYSLRRKLRENNRQLSLNEAAYIIESVAEALGAAHSNKILHRDIKPENIMLTPQEDEADFERVRLIDFGIARVEDSKLAPKTEVQRGIGTLLYMSPEQLAGNIEQTPAVDIYSLGIVAYEILTGRLPFKPQTLIEMFQMQQAGVKTLPRELRSDLPEKAEKLLLSALEFEPEKRTQSVRNFGRELANALSENPTAKTELKNDSEKPATTEFVTIKSTKNPPVNPTVAAVNETGTNLPEKTLPETERKKSAKPFIYVLLALLIFSAAALFGGFAYWKSGEGTTKKTDEKTTVAEFPESNIGFFLTVQKMRNGKEFEEPFRSSGQEIFENGYKFKMNFQTDSGGFIYLFNESKEPNGKTIFNILYPTPKTKNGSAEIEKDERIETNQNTLGEEKGTEIVWLIWTKDKQEILETMRKEAFDGNGVLKNEDSVKKMEEFIKKHSQTKTETSKDSKNQQTEIKAEGDIIAHKIELEYR
ncbi:MAG: serine/threonine protein kinase [Pyrinomonadaceae bacterium]